MDRVRRSIAVIAVIGCFLSGCGVPAPPGPSAVATTTAPAAPVASPSFGRSSAAPGPSGDAGSRVADLAYLVERLKAIHPNPFLDEGEAAFLARVARIGAEAASMTDEGFLVSVMDLMGHRDRDGHSGAWAMAQAGSNLHAWPVWLWDFPDGLRVVAAREPYIDLVGARLTKVGGASVEDARRRVEPLVPRDNPSSLRSNLPVYLTLPEVLAELGLVQPGEPALTFDLLDGSIRALTPDPLPMEAFRDWIFGVYGGRFPDGLPPDPAGPLYLQHRDRAFWSVAVKDPPGFYVGYNEVARPAVPRASTTTPGRPATGSRSGMSRPPCSRRPTPGRTGRSSSTCATTAVGTTTRTVPSGRRSRRSPMPTREACP